MLTPWAVQRRGSKEEGPKGVAPSGDPGSEKPDQHFVGKEAGERVKDTVSFCIPPFLPLRACQSVEHVAFRAPQQSPQV